MSKGFIKSKTTTWTDENGRVQSSTTEKEFTYKTEEDSFYMVFFNFVSWMYGIKSVTALKLLALLLESAEFNTGRISISSGIRKALCSKLDVSSSMFSKALNELVDNNALLPYEMDGEIIRGEYTVNPNMFWKGDLRKRKDLQIVFRSKEEDLDTHNNIQVFEESKEF